MENPLRPCTVCKKPCTDCCGKCLKAPYCSTQCQKSHWKLHRLECFPVKFRICPDTTRRSIVVTEDFSAGKVIWKETPLVYGCFNRMNYETCIQGGTSTVFCVGCSEAIKPGDVIYYCRCTLCLCSEGCDMMKVHKAAECSVFETLLKKNNTNIGISPTDLTILLRILHLKKTNPVAWKKFMSLNRNPNETDLTQLSPFHDEISEELIHWIAKGDGLKAASAEQRKAYVRLSGTLDQLTVGGFHDWTPDEIFYILKIMDWNAIEDFSISSGKWICYYGSSFRHSCAPNVTWRVDKKKNIHFRALVNMKKGDEIRMSKESYALLDGTPDRREMLRDMHGFLCTCERCADPTELGSYASALKCTDKNCQGFLLLIDPLLHASQRKCSACQKIVDENKRKESSMLNRCTKLTNESKGCNYALISGLLSLVKEFEKVLHPSHYELIMVTKVLAGKFLDCIVPAILGKDSAMNTNQGRAKLREVAKASVVSARVILGSRNPAFAPWTHRRGTILLNYFSGAAFLHKHGGDKIWSLLGGKMTKEEVEGLRKEAVNILEFYADTSGHMNRIALMEKIAELTLQ